MGAKQTTFLVEFADAFREHFGQQVKWNGGQALGNTASLMTHVSGRRPVGVKKAERFELGDLTATFLGWKIIVEFESKQVPLSNLLKYWPYLRGDLSTRAECPVMLCHFSDWWSYATYRDLWEWTLNRMQIDADRLVDIHGHQFDHGGEDIERRRSSIRSAIHWIAATVQANPLK